jgi:hypothetical protein
VLQAAMEEIPLERVEEAQKSKMKDAAKQKKRWPWLWSFMRLDHHLM